MKAVDTNVVARAIVCDDPRQTAIAETLLRDGVYISLTVRLEPVWLLRSRYGLNREAVLKSVRSVADLPRVSLEEAEQVDWLFSRIEAGSTEWADLIHIISARGPQAFSTFDAGVVLQAGARSPVPVETLA